MILLGSIGILMWVSASLTGLVIVLLALVMAPLFIFGKRVRELTIDAQDRFAEAVGYAGETFDALDTVQAFGREKMVAGRFAALVENSFRASQARVRARSIMTAMVVGLVFMGIVGVLWLGSRWVLGGAMTGGALAQFFLLSVIAAGAVGSLGESWGEVQRASGAMQRIAELLGAEIARLAEPCRCLAAAGEVAFENVTFAYRGAGRRRCGFPSGAAGGDGGAGRAVGGARAPCWAAAALLRPARRPCGWTASTCARPTRRVRARWRWWRRTRPAVGLGGRTSASARGRQEEVREAARHAERCSSWRLPQGLETLAGDRAGPVGGPAPALAIARAFVRDAPVLLLDEATSALDAESERLVQHAIEEAMANRTDAGDRPPAWPPVLRRRPHSW
jgi:ATP-binding cassette subfamily B protein